MYTYSEEVDILPGDQSTSHSLASVYFLYQGKKKAAQPFKPSVMSTKSMNLNFSAAAPSSKSPKDRKSTAKAFKPTVTSTKDINLNFSSLKTPVRGMTAATKQTNVTMSARKSVGAGLMSARKSLGARASAARKSLSSKGQVLGFDLANSGTLAMYFSLSIRSSVMHIICTRRLTCTPTLTRAHIKLHCTNSQSLVM